MYECRCEIFCDEGEPSGVGSSNTASVGGNVVLKSMLRWCVWMQSQYMAKEGQSSLLDFHTNWSFFGGVVQVHAGYFLWISDVDGDSQESTMELI